MKPATAEKYRREVCELTAWRDGNNLAHGASGGLEGALVGYLEFRYFEGRSASRGGCVLAAGRFSGILAPGSALFAGNLMLAVMLFLQFVAYRQPAELTNLAAAQVVDPQGRKRHGALLLAPEKEGIPSKTR